MRMPTNHERCVAALQALDIPVTESAAEQMRIMAQALLVFHERNQRYRDLWKGDGYRGSLFQMKGKLLRMWSIFWTGHPDPESLKCDDAVDLINYTCFFIRNVEAGNEHGQWE